MRTIEVKLNNTWNGKLAMEPVKVEIEKGEEVETQNYFLKLSAFFTIDQVEKLEVD